MAFEIRQSLTVEFHNLPSIPDLSVEDENRSSQVAAPKTDAEGPTVDATPPATASGPQPLPPDRVLQLTWTHLLLLLRLDDPWKRAFYENECLAGGWSVRQLRRQIESLLYERTGLSTDKRAVVERARGEASASPARIEDLLRDPYVLEFTGLAERAQWFESDLERALLEHLQAFLLELGTGFCFEARQKRILIGDSHNFVDLVFYHRILKCHVLLELKVAAFSHENIGQLNTYVSWYRKNMMTAGDNPPVGILLCTQKDHALVEYALAGIDNGLFVSKYLLELPKKEEMQRFIEEQLAAGALGETTVGEPAVGESGFAEGDR